jgi:hypothetical protein
MPKRFGRRRRITPSDVIWSIWTKNLFFEIFTFFYPFLPILDKIKYFGQNKSSRAQILASILFLNGESEKVGPMEIC